MLILLCVLALSGCGSLGGDDSVADVKVCFHFLRTFNGSVWQDVSGVDVLKHGAGNDGRFRGNADCSFVFTLPKETDPSLITNWFFDTSLGTALTGVEAGVRFLAGNPGFCGVYFPSAPASSKPTSYEGYFLGINTAGEFSVYYTDPAGTTSPLVIAEECNAAVSGYDRENVLKAYIEGARLVMQVNGRTVHTVEGVSLASGRTGIFVRVAAPE